MSKPVIDQKKMDAEEPSPSLQELIDQQGVSPVEDLDELSDLWPVNDDPDLLLQYILADRAERRCSDS